MPEWLFGGLITLAVTVVTVIGVVLGHMVTSKSAKRTSEQQFIDQLQEELSRYRFTADARATVQNERIERIERQNKELTEERDTLRSYAHDLRGHIFDGKPPPPPTWPADVLK